MPQQLRGATNRKTRVVVASKHYGNEETTIYRTIPNALGPHHQPGQRASASYENPPLKALGVICQLQQHTPSSPPHLLTVLTTVSTTYFPLHIFHDRLN